MFFRGTGVGPMGCPVIRYADGVYEPEIYRVKVKPGLSKNEIPTFFLEKIIESG